MIDNPNAGSSRMVPAWHVLRVEDQTSYQPGKGAVRVKRVWYALFDGSESYEDFPAAKFDLAKVEQAIDQAAQLIYQATQLKGADVTVGGS